MKMNKKMKIQKIKTKKIVVPNKVIKITMILMFLIYKHMKIPMMLKHMKIHIINQGKIKLFSNKYIFKFYNYHRN